MRFDWEGWTKKSAKNRWVGEHLPVSVVPGVRGTATCPFERVSSNSPLLEHTTSWGKITGWSRPFRFFFQRFRRFPSICSKKYHQESLKSLNFLNSPSVLKPTPLSPTKCHGALIAHRCGKLRTHSPPSRLHKHTSPSSEPVSTCCRSGKKLIFPEIWRQMRQLKISKKTCFQLGRPHWSVEKIERLRWLPHIQKRWNIAVGKTHHMKWLVCVTQMNRMSLKLLLKLSGFASWFLLIRHSPQLKNLEMDFGPNEPWLSQCSCGGDQELSSLKRDSRSCKTRRKGPHKTLIQNESDWEKKTLTKHVQTRLVTSYSTLFSKCPIFQAHHFGWNMSRCQLPTSQSFPWPRPQRAPPRRAPRRWRNSVRDPVPWSDHKDVDDPTEPGRCFNWNHLEPLGTTWNHFLVSWTTIWTIFDFFGTTFWKVWSFLDVRLVVHAQVKSQGTSQRDFFTHVWR